MKIGNSTWSFHRLFEQGSMDAFSFPSECKQFGISSLEYVEDHVGGTDREHLDQLKQIIRKANCEIVAIAINDDLTYSDPKAAEEQVEHVREWLNIASYLGAKVARIFTGGADTADPEAAVQRVINNIKKLLDTAEETGVELVLENHGGLSGTPEYIEKIVKGVDSIYFGTCPDFGNFPESVDRYEGLKLLVPYAKHVHAKALNFNSSGEESCFDFRRILGILRQVGYDGTLSIEFEGSGDEREGVRLAADLIRRYL